MTQAGRQLAVPLPPWQSVLLDSVAKRGSGHTPDKKHPEYWNGDIKWLSLKDSERLDNLYIADTAERITPAGIANSSAVEHPAGTVVLSRDAGVGKSAITQDVMAVSQHFMAWQCGERLNSHFLYYWLQLKKPEFERIAIGNTIKTIGLPYFKALEIPLPSPHEQKAIAAALSDVDALLGALDRLIAKKRDLKQAAMQQLLTGQTRLPGFSKDWTDSTLGRHLRDPIRNGYSPVCPTVATGLWILSLSAVTEDGYSATGVKPAPLRDERVLANQLLPGDIVVSRSNTPERVGLAGLYRGDPEPCAYPDLMMRVRPSSSLDPEYLLAHLLSHRGRKFFSETARGSSSSMVKIDRSILESFPLPVPPLPEQKAIAAVLSDMDVELTALEQRRDKTRLLKQGMMQELLTGRTRLV